MRAYWRPLPAWPYPPRTKRKGLFRSSWSRSLELLGEEVERVDGSDLMIGVVADDSQFRIDGSLKANAILKHPGAEVSFEKDGRRLVFHTDTYDHLHWLDVVWLCSSHHIAIHVAVNPWAEARRAAGLSLRELEQRSGVNRGLLSLLERGRLIPTPDQAAVILRALTATTDETLR